MIGPSPPKAQMYGIAADCAKEGMEAFKAGIDECPYPTGSVNERAWWEAWEMAKQRAEWTGTIIVK